MDYPRIWYLLPASTEILILRGWVIAVVGALSGRINISHCVPPLYGPLPAPHDNAVEALSRGIHCVISHLTSDVNSLPLRLMVSALRAAFGPF
jgi:hypothetical protein